MLNEKELLNFLELLAHKIKNPLHSMGLNLEAMKIQAAKIKSDALLKHVKITQAEQARLNKIVQAAIDYLAPGDQQPSRLPVDHLFAELRQLSMPFATEKQVDLSFSIEENCSPLKTSRDKLRKALAYLIQNAIEAVSKNGAVKVIALQKKGILSIEIHDNGGGITRDDAKKIANFYYTTKQGHVGMGLPLARKYIEENKGKLRMQSKTGKGTTVIISFENKD